MANLNLNTHNRNSLDGWRDAGAKNVEELAKPAVQTWLEKLNLPHYWQVKTSAKEFLRDPTHFLSQLRTSRFWPTLMQSADGGGRHIREANFTADQTVKYVEANQCDFPEVLIREYLPNIFGGVLEIWPERIYAEVVRGTITDLLYGQPPMLRMWRDDLTGLFQFDNETTSKRLNVVLENLGNLRNAKQSEWTRKQLQAMENDFKESAKLAAQQAALQSFSPQLRATLHRTLECVPHDGQPLCERQYHEGHYEFFWTFANEEDQVKNIPQDWGGEPMDIIFTEYQNNPVHNPWYRTDNL